MQRSIHFWRKRFPGAKCAPGGPGGGRPKGFTLIELVIVIAIAAILLAIGIPQYARQRASRDLEGSQRELQTLFNYARSVGIQQNSPQGTTYVTLTFTTATDSFSCTLTDCGSATLRQYNSPEGIAISLPSGITTYTFLANGSIGVSGAFTTGTFTLSSGTGMTRTLTLYTTTGAVTISP